MSDLTSIFGGAWSPPTPKQLEPPEQQLRTEIIEAGLEPPDEIYLDGKLHRFRSGSKGSAGAGDKTGWYICFGDGVPAGRFGDWRLGIEQTFRADVGRKLSAAEEMANTRRMAEARAIREAELEKKREAVADTVEQIWMTGAFASADHPYLVRKRTQPHGARVTGDGRLMVPLFTPDGEISTLQYIDQDGKKLYHPGGATGGMFWCIGSVTSDHGDIFVAEGYATSSTVHEVTSRPCFVAYSASNLPAVVESLREKYGAMQSIVIVADNDKGGIGQRYAEQACAKFGARFVMPPNVGEDANDYHNNGNDLLALIYPKREDWLIPADDFCAQPAPIRWLVKHWLQRDALIMVHGPSGGGKTFVVLDWCMRIASGFEAWGSHKIHPGPAVYLAGEGHHGLRSRLAGWRHHNGVKSGMQMWISKSGLDLNTAEGYARTVEHLRSLKVLPSIIIVDTLHRFLAGDENSSQDAKTMLDACAALMAEFKCSVLLVHHTGVSDEAQHRARGSSAWRGALDIEISVVPATGPGQPMQLVQRKSKDAEVAAPMWCVLESVDIPGWIDEDGQQVTTAIIKLVDAPNVPIGGNTTLMDGAKKALEGAWQCSGKEDRGGAPYVTRSAMREALSIRLRVSKDVDKHMDAMNASGSVGVLINAKIIEPYEHGWIVVEPITASAIILTR